MTEDERQRYLTESKQRERTMRALEKAAVHLRKAHWCLHKAFFCNPSAGEEFPDKISRVMDDSDENHGRLNALIKELKTLDDNDEWVRDT